MHQADRAAWAVGRLEALGVWVHPSCWGPLVVVAAVPAPFATSVGVAIVVESLGLVPMLDGFLQSMLVSWLQLGRLAFDCHCWLLVTSLGEALGWDWNEALGPVVAVVGEVVVAVGHLVVVVAEAAEATAFAAAAVVGSSFVAAVAYQVAAAFVVAVAEVHPPFVVFVVVVVAVVAAAASFVAASSASAPSESFARTFVSAAHPLC